MSCITYPLPARNALFRIKALVFQLVVPNSRMPNNLTKRLTHPTSSSYYATQHVQSPFLRKKAVGEIGPDSRHGRITINGTMSQFSCKLTVRSSFGIPRQIKQPAKASKPNASTECLRLLRIYRFKLCERFETDPYRYSYRRQRGSLDHRQASEDGYTVPCQTSPRC